MRILKKACLAVAAFCAATGLMGCGGGTDDSGDVLKGQGNICYYLEQADFDAGDKEIWIECKDRKHYQGMDVRIWKNGNPAGQCTVRLGSYASYSGVGITITNSTHAEKGFRVSTVLLDFSNASYENNYEPGEETFTQMIAITHPKWVVYDPDGGDGSNGAAYTRRGAGLIAKLTLEDTSDGVMAVTEDGSNIGDSGFKITKGILTDWHGIGSQIDTIKGPDWCVYNLYGKFLCRDLAGGVPSQVGKK